MEKPIAGGDAFVVSSWYKHWYGHEHW